MNAEQCPACGAHLYYYDGEHEPEGLLEHMEREQPQTPVQERIGEAGGADVGTGDRDDNHATSRNGAYSR